MNNLTIWQRLNLTVTILIFVLAVGGGLAFWMEHARIEAEASEKNRRNDLTNLKYEATRYSLAIRGAALNGDKNELLEARKNLDAAVSRLTYLELAYPQELRRELNTFEATAATEGFAAKAASSYVTLQGKIETLIKEVDGKANTA